MKRFARLLIFTFAVLIAHPSAHAATITIGGGGEGPAGKRQANFFPFAGVVNDFPCCPPGTRYQQVYNSALFPSEGITITAISFFVPGRFYQKRVAEADYSFFLSTTSKSVNFLDTTNLDANVGPDNTLVFSAFLSGVPGA